MNEKVRDRQVQRLIERQERGERIALGDCCTP
jgi:hypothetical protein